LDAELVGLSAMSLGAGRFRGTEKINHAVGIELLKKLGDKVEQGEPVARFHLADGSRFEESRELFEKAVRVSPEPPEPAQLVIEEIN
jgi:thymidine phosphorylase